MIVAEFPEEEFLGSLAFEHCVAWKQDQQINA